MDDPFLAFQAFTACLACNCIQQRSLVSVGKLIDVVVVCRHSRYVLSMRFLFALLLLTVPAHAERPTVGVMLPHCENAIILLSEGPEPVEAPWEHVGAAECGSIFIGFAMAWCREFDVVKTIDAFVTTLGKEPELHDNDFYEVVNFYLRHKYACAQEQL